VPLTHHDVITNGVRLHVVSAGDPANPLVILLHGFPEFWYGWRHQIPALAGAGYYVLAPDQRGYNLSDKPAGLDAYALPELAADVVGLIDWAGRDQALLVGHDWGAEVAWWTALTHPQRVRRLGILNVPHPSVMVKTLRTNPAQMLRSWYIGFFQIPGLPEWLLSQNNAEGLALALLRSSRPGSFTDRDIPFYVEAWRQPGALTAMLNWYRSIAQRPPESLTDSRVRVPTLIQWGRNDIALVPDMAEASLAYCDDGRLITYDEATHWLQHDVPEAVNARLLEFFRQENA
jgi:pimeloyl-ACP methyl ester carboxylesterase